MVNEGASTFIMSLKCWKALGPPTLAPSHAMLKEFDGHSFPPHRLIVSFSIQFGGKIVTIDVEVVDVPID